MSKGPKVEGLMEIITIETPALGDRSHVLVQDREADLEGIPDGEVWVNCASGYRASIAASLLDRAGRTVVAIDDEWATDAKHDALGVSTD